VVPQGQARIRTQLSADHDVSMLQRALEAFNKVGDNYGILGLDKKGIEAKFGM
jgi:glycine C-acetyltransferase